MFQQRLWEIMQDMIAKFPISGEEKKIQYEESKKFRLPYWDWGVPQSYSGKYGVPELLTKDDIEILIPGTQFKDKERYPNPLDKFSNPLGVPMGDKKMGLFAIPDTREKDDHDNEIVLPGHIPKSWSMTL